MTFVLAEDAKLYRNTASYATPTWSEMDNVIDLTLNLEKEEADVTTRGSGGWTEVVDGKKDATVEFQMLWDTADTNFTALQDAFLNNTSVEVLVLDGPEGTAGSQGLRATMMVKSFSRSEDLGDALKVDVSLRPVKNSDAAPEWYTDAGS